MNRLKKPISVLLVGYFFITVTMYLLQEKLIFLPTQLPQEFHYHFDQDFDEVFIETEDGARLNALHFKTQKPKGIVLYFHGNAGDLSRWGKITSYFEQYNYDVLVMDYRSYGKSTGALSEKALHADADLFYKKAMTLFPEDQITVYGRSLGTTFASYVASIHSPKRLILESPFYSLKKLAKERYWFLPVETLLQYEFPSYKHLAKSHCPITIIHGTEDAVVPYTSGAQLYETLPKDQANLVTIMGGSHNNLIDFSGYHDAINNVLQ